MKKFIFTCIDRVIQKSGIHNIGLLWNILRGKKYYIRNENQAKMFSSFETYLHDKTHISALKEGLDQESCSIIDKQLVSVRLINTHNMIDTDQHPGFIQSKEWISKEKEVSKKYTLPVIKLEECVFLHHHGMKHIPNIENRMTGKDVIDCGGYIGDSALMFADQLPNSRYVFTLEPLSKNLKTMKKVISNNGFKEKIMPVAFGVGSRKHTVQILDQGSASKVVDNTQGTESIAIDTLDNIVHENKILPGLIKRDIEGAEYDSLLGAKNIIAKYKPILLISIYHCGKDYFEIKPLIQSRDLGYTFKIRHFRSDHPIGETMLLCY